MKKGSPKSKGRHRGALPSESIIVRLKVDDAYSVVDLDAVRAWQRAFESIGAQCGIHGTDQWGRDDLDVDICVVMEGQEPYYPKPYNFNVLVSREPMHSEKRAGVQLVLEAGVSPVRNSIRRQAENILNAHRAWAKSERHRTERSLDTWFAQARTPKVSVLIATFNRLPFIRRTLDSVVEQRYPNWEVILVNDGGSSVADIVSAIGDERIHLIENGENRGKCFSLNQACRASTGEFLAYLDDDDIWYPDHLQRLLLPLLTLPVEMAYSDAEEVTVAVDETGQLTELERKTELQRQTNLSRLLSVNEIRGISYAHSRRLFDVCEGFDDALRVLDDWDMLRRLAMHTYPYHVSYTTARFDRRVGALGLEMPHMTHSSMTQTVRYFADRKRIVDKVPEGSLTKEQLEIVTRMRQLAAADLLAAEGHVREKDGHVDAAVDLYQRAMSVLPTHVLSARFLGIQYLKRGRTKDALQLFELCIASDTCEISDYLHAVVAAIGAGHPGKAVYIINLLRSSGLELNENILRLIDKYEATVATSMKGQMPST